MGASVCFWARPLRPATSRALGVGVLQSRPSTSRAMSSAVPVGPTTLTVSPTARGSRLSRMRMTRSPAAMSRVVLAVSRAVLLRCQCCPSYSTTNLSSGMQMSTSRVLRGDPSWMRIRRASRSTGRCFPRAFSMATSVEDRAHPAPVGAWGRP